TRSCACLPELTLASVERAAYEYCDELRSGASIIRHLRESFADIVFTDQQVIDFLDSLVANKLMVTDGENYLSLAVRARQELRNLERAAHFQSCDFPPQPASTYLRAELKVLPG